MSGISKSVMLLLARSPLIQLFSEERMAARISWARVRVGSVRKYQAAMKIAMTITMNANTMMTELIRTRIIKKIIDFLFFNMDKFHYRI